MTYGEIIDYLKVAGWTVHREDVDCYYAVQELSDRIVVIHFGRSNSVSELVWSITTKDFSLACSQIDETPYVPAPLDSTKIVTSKADTSEVVQRGLSWADEQDPDTILMTLASAAPDSPGLGALYHICALATLGDIAGLKDFRQNLLDNNRSSMAYYIEAGHIDRAISFAIET